MMNDRHLPHEGNGGQSVATSLRRFEHSRQINGNSFRIQQRRTEHEVKQELDE